MDGKNKERDVFMHKYSVTQIIKRNLQYKVRGVQMKAPQHNQSIKG